MKKNVFRTNEVKSLKDSVELALYKNYAPEEEEIIEDMVPEYTGPTADELRREADMFKKQWEIEKKELLDSTESESQQIIQNAEKAANDLVEQKTHEAEEFKVKAREEADQIVADAQVKAEAMIAEAQTKVDEIRQQAQKEGFEKGREEGYVDGKDELSRVVETLHTVVSKTLDRRQEILMETEQQIIDLVLLVSRKVIKVISESQRTIVLENIKAALKKMHVKGDVTVRVNLVDLKIATEHAKEFVQMVELDNHINFVEDSSVEPGGCIVETDFGSIDARISSQLIELEQRILDISPIK